MSQFSIVVNRQANKVSEGIIRSVGTIRPVEFPELIIGGSRNVELTIVDGLNGIDAISGNAAVQPTVAIGSRCNFPTGGTFTFTRGANTTEALAYNITPEALQTALEGLASIGANNVSVTGVAGKYYKIEYIGSLADTDIDDATSDGSLLQPTSTANLTRLVEGGSGENEEQVLRLKQIPFVLQTAWTAGDNSWTGRLSTGTWEALLELNEQSPIEAIVEISIKLADGTVEKLVQQPAIIYCDVSDPDQFVPASFPTYLTATQINAKFATANVLWVSKSGNDSTGTRGRFDLPFLTVGAAQTAASSGDVIRTLQGDYSSETIGGKDGVFYDFLEGSTGPAINVTTAITVKGRGLCQSLICNNSGAVMDMPDMDTVAFILCDGGTQTAGNAGSSIECLDGTQTAGNAGTVIFCDGGTQTAGNAGSSIQCQSGTQTAGNAGTYIQCFGGTQTIHLTNQSHDGTTSAPIALLGSGNLTIRGNTSESTQSNGTVINIANNWSGSLVVDGLTLIAKNAGTDGATNGIRYGTGVTGNLTLKDVTIITAQNGSGVGKSIDAPSAQTVLLEGSLNQNFAVDSDITIDGGTVNTNANYTR